MAEKDKLKEYIKGCGTEISLSKTLTICRMAGPYQEYWINILSQVTIQNELTPAFKKYAKANKSKNN